MTVPDDPANRHRQIIADWEAEGNTIPTIGENLTFAEAKAAKFKELNSIRFQHETGGMMFQNVFVKTDRESTAIITAAYITALADPEFTMNWKVMDGVFATLTAQHIIALGTAIRNHIQECFNREMEITSIIHQATTIEELNVIDLESGWPNA